MSHHIDAARRALHQALVELDRTYPAAVHEAGRWTARALGILLDLEQAPEPTAESDRWVAAVINAASEGKNP